MIFAIVSSVVVVITLLGLALAITALSSRAGPSSRSMHPYNILDRRIPTAQRVEQLFPQKLGPFERKSYRSEQAMYVRATDGAQITIRATQAVSLAAAQALVKRVIDTNGPANSGQYWVEADPRASYYLNITDQAVRLVWSRNIWYFDLQTGSKETLDEFMNFFEY